jgi:hypothetical protein
MRNTVNDIIIAVYGIGFNLLSHVTRDDVNFVLSIIISVLVILKYLKDLKNGSKKNN